MPLDAQTLRDLEVFQGTADGPSLFDFLDRTTTHDGRRRLQHRFKHPLTEPDEIVTTQNILRFLAAHLPTLTFPFQQKDFDWLQGYLESNFEVCHLEKDLWGRLQGRWLATRNREFVAFAQRGIVGTLQFLAAAEGFFGLLGRDSSPPAIEGDRRFLADIVAHGGLKDLLADPTNLRLDIASELGLDRLFRRDLKASLLDLLRRLTEMDCLLAMARATKDLGFIFPTFTAEDTPKVIISGLFHPFLAEAVRNDVELGGNHRLWFLTGPNMAGKTTFMKAAAIAVHLAHLGMGVPAADMRLTPFSQVFCTLNAMDDIRNRISSFCSEIRRVKEVLVAIRGGSRVFAVFDELFKGTNVQDALDCSEVVIDGFARSAGSAFLVSSHLLELHSRIAHRPEIMFRCFEAHIEGNHSRFDYRLREGVNPIRLGYHLLVEEGVLKLLE
jgi:DNA mismatch repair protein MutS